MWFFNWYEKDLHPEGGGFQYWTFLQQPFAQNLHELCPNKIKPSIGQYWKWVDSSAQFIDYWKWDLHWIFGAVESPSRNIHNLLSKLDHLISKEIRLISQNRTRVINYKLLIWINLVNWRICSINNHRNVKHFTHNIHKEIYG